jgi:hypothetical protein
MQSKTGKSEEGRLKGVLRRVKGIRHRAICIVLLLPSIAIAGERTAASIEYAKLELADLTFSNFLSTGWNEPWTRRPRGDGTPDMSLLRVQTNFLAQLYRMDYLHQENSSHASVGASDSLSGTLEYAFNRRLMLALIGNYGWLDSRSGPDLYGATGGAFARVHLVDTSTDSLATTFRVGIPNHELGEKDITLSLSVAGWHDLATLGLKRVGLYYHMQEEMLAGPIKSGGRRNDFTCAISLAKTWTSPESLFGNATTFVETYGKTDLDGENRGHTVLTVTPGVRATFAHRHIVMAGVEFPVTNPRPFERIVRLTYICNF